MTRSAESRASTRSRSPNCPLPVCESGEARASPSRVVSAVTESRQQFAVVAPKPPSPSVSGAFPTVLGISPEIGPPFAAAAGVESV